MHVIVEGDPQEAWRAVRVVCWLVEVTSGVECRADGITVRQIRRQGVLL